MSAVVTTMAIEALGVSAVPFKLFRTPVSLQLRILKPMALTLLSATLTKLFGPAAATLVILGNATLAMLLHRKFCIEHGNPWITSRSPFLYRNEAQMRLWAKIAKALGV